MMQLQQIANAEILSANWDQIRLLIGDMSPALAAGISAIAAKLQNPISLEELPKIIDDLLRLIRDTPAGSYARQFIARANMGDTATTRSANPDVLAPAGIDPRPLVESTGTARNLGSVLTACEDSLGITRFPILYATNREWNGTAYTGEPGALSYGYTWVTIPANHAIGNIEKPSWWNRLADPGDPKKYFTCEVHKVPTPEFLSQLEQACQFAGSRQILIFMHGFNVSFEEAAMRAAQFAQDSQFLGLIVLYSWPSQGTWYKYSADEARAAASGEKLAECLNDLVGGSWTQLSLLAHSMGNRVMLSALADNNRPKLPFGQLVMAAADVYIAEFQSKFDKLQQHGFLPCTSYSSHKDIALKLSSFIHSGPRVGLIEDFHFDVGDHESIDATAVDRGILAHGYWSGDRVLITDIRSLVLDGFRAKKRGLKKSGTYWTFPK
jgi:esterase/lipase superfamily enzyme